MILVVCTIIKQNYFSISSWGSNTNYKLEG